MFLASRWWRRLRPTPISPRVGKPRPRRPHPFRPEVQPLEDRCCPSCTYRVVDGHTLQVLGDQTNNDIVIADSRPLSIQVTCNGRTSPLFTGITDLQIEPGDGNDSVRFPWELPSVPTHTEIDFGNGNNFLLDDWSHATPLPPGVPMAPMPEVITMGSGNNQVTELAPPHGADVNVHFGNGADRFTALFPVVRSSDSATAPTAPMPPAHLAVEGGAGHDTVRALIGLLDEARPPAPFTTPVDLHFTAGSGRSDLSVAYRDVAILAPQTVALTGVHNDAAVTVSLHDVEIQAPLTVAFRGGPEAPGGNDVRVIWPADGGVVVNGEVTMTDNRTPRGNDVRVIYDVILIVVHDATEVRSHLDGSVEMLVPPEGPFAVEFSILPF